MARRGRGQNSGSDFNAVRSSAMACPLAPENRCGAQALCRCRDGRDAYHPVHGELEPWTIRRPARNGGMGELNDRAIRVNERVLLGVWVAVA